MVARGGPRAGKEIMQERNAREAGGDSARKVLDTCTFFYKVGKGDKEIHLPAQWINGSISEKGKTREKKEEEMQEGKGRGGSRTEKESIVLSMHPG